MLRYIKKRVHNRQDGAAEHDLDYGALPSSSSSSQQFHQQSSLQHDAFGSPSKNSNHKHHTSSGGVTKISLAEQQRHLDATVVSQRRQYLANFDACIEACDALAASSATTTNSSSLRRHPETHLVDCSVLVSPDGDLLLMPSSNTTTSASADNNNNNNNGETTSDTNNNNNMDGSSNSVHSSTAMSELGEDYESAIYVGCDLDPRGDRALNGFTANGWSIPATSFALRQTEQSLHDFADFCEEIVLAKKEAAARQNLACDKLRAASFERGPVYPNDLKRDAQLLLQTTYLHGNVPFEMNPHRVGPMLMNGGTLHAAQVAVEEFYATMAERETERWRLASLQRKGALPALRKAATLAEERSLNRQETLREIYSRVKVMEDHLTQCQKEAKQKWLLVAQAEDKVTKRMEEQMIKRQQWRETQRLKEFHQQAAQAVAAGQQLGTGDSNGDDEGGENGDGASNSNNNAISNQAEIWDIVSQVTESMENGSFEPIHFSTQTASLQIGSGSGDAWDVQHSASMSSGNFPHHLQPQLSLSRESADDELPVASRMDIENEVGIPALRSAAFAADRAVRQASSSLLNVLSSLDQVRRSSRIAAETNLLSACNSQAACIRSIVRLERAAAEERLREIERVEQFIDKINVRHDLDTYIIADRKRPGGSAPLGLDDDGGIASALAVLTSHVEGDMTMDSNNTNNGTTSPGSQYNNNNNNNNNSHATTSGGADGTTPKESLAEKVSPEELEEAIEVLFAANDMLKPDAPDSKERQEAHEKFNEAVSLLCNVAEEKSKAARPRRSRICYSLNSKRGSITEIRTPMQFEALCRVFVSVLNGCDCESGGVANAKMCMMLSQSFYRSEKGQERRSNSSGKEVSKKNDGDEDQGGERSKRIYVKNRLVGHPLWSVEEFWDQVLYQCLSESLTNSGVMSNFERLNATHPSPSTNELRESRKMQWYDLSPIERHEAASQVHAVVFAQLGALAHSMIEFGCGLERSCAFVRRMAIRNQLPMSQRTILLQHLVERKHDNDQQQLLEATPVVATKNGENTKQDQNDTIIPSQESPAADKANHGDTLAIEQLPTELKDDIAQDPESGDDNEQEERETQPDEPTSRNDKQNENDTAPS